MSRILSWRSEKKEVSGKQGEEEEKEEGQDSSFGGTVGCYVKRRRK